MTDATLLPAGVAWRDTRVTHIAVCRDDKCPWTFRGATATETWEAAVNHVAVARHHVGLTTETVTDFTPKADRPRLVVSR